MKGVLGVYEACMRPAVIRGARGVLVSFEGCIGGV